MLKMKNEKKNYLGFLYHNNEQSNENYLHDSNIHLSPYQHHSDFTYVLHYQYQARSYIVRSDAHTLLRVEVKNLLCMRMMYASIQSRIPQLHTYCRRRISKR